MDWKEYERRCEEARKKAESPTMTLAGNPLVMETLQEVNAERLVASNMRRLRQDAEARQCATNGAVYAGLMDMRYKGE